jgi:integrase
VHRIIDTYTSQVGRQHWPSIAEFVRSAVFAMAPDSVSQARAFLVATSHLVLWSWQTAGLELETKHVFEDGNIARFLEHPSTQGWSHNYRYCTGIRLLGMARRLDGQSRRHPGVPTSRKRRFNPHFPRPYSEPELTTFRSSAARRPNERRRRNALVLLSLGAGAGLRPREITDARVADVTDTTSGMSVKVRGKRARTVPVHSRWEKSMRLAIDGRPADAFAFTGYRYKANPTAVLHSFTSEDPGEFSPEAGRLHTTWVINQLQAAVPLDIVVHLAGLTSPSALDRYFVLMSEPNADRIADFRSAITGREME